MKVRVRKMAAAEPTPWCMDIPELRFTPQYSWSYRTWPDAIEAALSLWEQLNCQIAT